MLLQKVQTNNPDIQQLQSQLTRVLDPLLRNILLDGTLIPDISVLTSNTMVPHNLNRPINGWIVVGKNANADIWQVSKDTRFLTLIATAQVTCSLWVF